MNSRQCGDWLEAYMEYTSEQESPKAFHEWTALAVLSATLGRHLFLDRGYYTIFPNLFIILVAGSAKCRKSISTHIGINLLRELRNSPMVFAQKITNEALIGALKDARLDNKCAGIIYASELSVFMGSEPSKAGLIPTLTDLYDSPTTWSYHTKGRGLEQLKNVSISMLAATTKDWLKTSIPADAVGGGFTSRIIFVCQDSPRKAILFPRPDSVHAGIRTRLLEDLNHIREQKGPMDLTPDARERASKWYASELFKDRDPRMEGYYGRKHDTMFKVAMILSMAESDDRWIDLNHINKALAILEANEKSLFGVMQSVTATEMGSETEKILTIIRKAGKITHSDLLRKCWRYANAADMSAHIKTLVESKEIDECLESDNRTRYYMPSVTAF